MREPLIEHGVRLSDTAADAASGAEIVLTILSDGDAVTSAMEGERERCEPIFEAVGQRTVWLGEAGTATRMKLRPSWQAPRSSPPSAERARGYH